jgi:hypothetical protein
MWYRFIYSWRTEGLENDDVDEISRGTYASYAYYELSWSENSSFELQNYIDWKLSLDIEKVNWVSRY